MPKTQHAGFVVPVLCDLSECQESIDRPEGKSWIRTASDAELQSRLYFGCLNEICALLGVVFDVNEFITLHDDKQIITTKKLFDLFPKWKERVTKLSQRQRDKEFTQVDKALQKMSTHALELQNSSSSGSHNRAVIVESIVILGWTLHSFARRIYRGNHMAYVRWPPTTYSFERLKSADFCPAEIKSLTDIVDVGGLYYLGFLRSPRSGFDHDACEEIVCRGNKIRGVDKYETRHVAECKGCGEFINARDTMHEIVGKGGIPLVAWKESTDKLDIIEYIVGMSYVAISHV